MDKVRYVGEGVAVVVADSRYLAEDARDMVEVEYEPLAGDRRPAGRARRHRNLVHDDLGTNIAYERTFNFGDVEGDFAEADVVITDRLRWHRSGGQPLETVGAIADLRPRHRRDDGPHQQLSITSFLFGLAASMRVPANKLDLVPHPAGGSFGARFSNWRSAVTAALGAKVRAAGEVLRGPRRQHLQLRPPRLRPLLRGRAGDERDGMFRSFRIDVVDDYGAYIQFGVGTTATRWRRSSVRTRSRAPSTGCGRC